MSHRTSMRVWEHSQTRGAMRCLMLAIADLANDDGICWPGTAFLAEKINEHPDHTATIIKKCIEAGELAQVVGQGRGHKTRFAVLCGLPPDAANKLKGVLQKGYSSTPIEKRGTAKGVLSSGKRGTFKDLKYPSIEASGSDETPQDEKLILHDPDHEGEGEARARKKRSEAKSVPRHVLYLSEKGMWAAPSFSGLDSDAAIADFDARRAAGQTIDSIVTTWRSTPPTPGAIYERPTGPVQSATRADNSSRSVPREKRQPDQQPPALTREYLQSLPTRGELRKMRAQRADPGVADDGTI